MFHRETWPLPEVQSQDASQNLILCQSPWYTAASRFFSTQLGKSINKSSVISIHRSYLEEVKRKRLDGNSSQILKVPCKQRGRPMLLGAFDSKVQLYLKKVRESGDGVSSRIAIAAA